MASGSKTQTEIDNVIRKCAVQKNTPEQTAWEFYKCAYNESQGQNSRRNQIFLRYTFVKFANKLPTETKGFLCLIYCSMNNL